MSIGLVSHTSRKYYHRINLTQVRKEEKEGDTYISVHIGAELLRVIVVECDHASYWLVGVSIGPAVSLGRLARDFLLRNFHDHVVGHVAATTPALAPIEAVAVFVAPNLERNLKPVMNMRFLLML